MGDPTLLLALQAALPLPPPPTGVMSYGSLPLRPPPLPPSAPAPAPPATACLPPSYHLPPASSLQLGPEEGEGHAMKESVRKASRVYRKRWGPQGPGVYDFGSDHQHGCLGVPPPGDLVPNIPPKTGMGLRLRPPRLPPNACVPPPWPEPLVPPDPATSQQLASQDMQRALQTHLVMNRLVYDCLEPPSNPGASGPTLPGGPPSSNQELGLSAWGRQGALPPGQQGSQPEQQQQGGLGQEDPPSCSQRGPSPPPLPLPLPALMNQLSLRGSLGSDSGCGSPAAMTHALSTPLLTASHTVEPPLPKQGQQQQQQQLRGEEARLPACSTQLFDSNALGPRDLLLARQFNASTSSGSSSLSGLREGEGEGGGEGADGGERTSAPQAGAHPPGPAQLRTLSCFSSLSDSAVPPHPPPSTLSQPCSQGLHTAAPPPPHTLPPRLPHTSPPSAFLTPPGPQPGAAVGAEGAHGADDGLGQRVGGSGGAAGPPPSAPSCFDYDEGLPAWYVPSGPGDTTLVFESRFESGNLRRAIQVHPHEYDLVLRPDVNTRGHTQWFFFALSNTRAGAHYKLNLINLVKDDSLYQEGMQPLVHSAAAQRDSGRGWHRAGHHIAYYRNRIKRSKSKYYSTLSFTITAEADYDTLHCAHCYPLTYTDLQRHLKVLEGRPSCRTCLQRSQLCTSLAGNSVDLLTITAHTDRPEVLRRRRGVLISARVHPGESNSSWMMKGLLDFLTGPSATAQQLRSQFVFKIIPMVNPDGVVVGNYRCNLAGVDLNRVWQEPHRKLHPVIVALKALLREFMEEREVSLFCDLHGHSRKPDVFVYGCHKLKDNAALFPGYPVPGTLGGLPGVEPRLQEKVLPLLLSHCAPDIFSYHRCAFKVQRSKAGTGRVVGFRELGLTNSLTLEATFAGGSTGRWAGRHFSCEALEVMGAALAASLADYWDPGRYGHEDLLAELEFIHPAGGEGPTRFVRDADGQLLEVPEGDDDEPATDSDDESSEEESRRSARSRRTSAMGLRPQNFDSPSAAAGDVEAKPIGRSAQRAARSKALRQMLAAEKQKASESVMACLSLFGEGADSAAAPDDGSAAGHGPQEGVSVRRSALYGPGPAAGLTADVSPLMYAHQRGIYRGEAASWANALGPGGLLPSAAPPATHPDPASLTAPSPPTSSNWAPSWLGGGSPARLPRCAPDAAAQGADRPGPQHQEAPPRSRPSFAQPAAPASAAAGEPLQGLATAGVATALASLRAGLMPRQHSTLASRLGGLGATPSSGWGIQGRASHRDLAELPPNYASGVLHRLQSPDREPGNRQPPTSVVLGDELMGSSTLPKGFLNAGLLTSLGHFGAPPLPPGLSAPALVATGRDGSGGTVSSSPSSSSSLPFRSHASLQTRALDSSSQPALQSRQASAGTAGLGQEAQQRRDQAVAIAMMTSNPLMYHH